MSTLKKIMKNSPIIIYIIMVTFAFCVILYLQIKCNLEDPNEIAYESARCDIDWFDEKGNKIESLESLNELGADNHYVYTVLPENIQENTSLCFRLKHVLFSAYVGETCVLERTLPDSRFYTNSVGVNWVMLPLKQSYAGQKLYLRYQLCYDEHGVGFSRMVMMSEGAYLIHLLKEKLVSIILPFSYLIIGLILIILDIAINRFTKKGHNLLFLGCLAVGVAFYCLAETQILPIFVIDQKILHLITMFSMAVVPVPIIIYSDYLFKFKYAATAPVFSAGIFVVFVVLTISNFFDIADYHENMLFLQLIVLFAFFMMLYAIARYVILTLRKKKRLDWHIRFTIIGLFLSMACGVIDIIRFWMKIGDDPVQFIRVGFLMFLLCFSMASSRQIIDAFKNSMKTELISRLAYEDGLTGLKNRTSYNEALETIEREQADAGIVVMDVNNLKLVNDNQGHNVGDEMLVYTSEIIRDAFHKEGMDCYRIGGDEFVVLVRTAHIKEDCEEGMHRLRELYCEFNETTDCSFKIVIAAGCQTYAHKGKKKLEDVIKMADNLMYEQKRRLKKEQKFG